MKKILIMLISVTLLLSGCSASSDNLVVNNIAVTDSVSFDTPSTFSIGTKEYGLTDYSNTLIDGKYELFFEFNEWLLLDDLPGYFQFLDDFEYVFLDENMNPVDVEMNTASSNRFTVTSSTEIKYVYMKSISGEDFVAWEV